MSANQPGRAAGPLHFEAQGQTFQFQLPCSPSLSTRISDPQYGSVYLVDLRVRFTERNPIVLCKGEHGSFNHVPVGPLHRQAADIGLFPQQDNSIARQRPLRYETDQPPPAAGYGVIWIAPRRQRACGGILYYEDQVLMVSVKESPRGWALEWVDKPHRSGEDVDFAHHEHALNRAVRIIKRHREHHTGRTT